MKKKILSLASLLLFTLILFSACTKSKVKEEDVEIFSTKKSYEVAYKYLELIKNNNIEEANKLCTENLISSNKEVALGTSKIIAYAPDDLIGSSKSSFVTFNVIRNSTSETKCDLDNYAIKVIKDGEEYKIDEIKAINLKQVFVRNKSLRLINEDGGKSDLIISLNNVPQDIYLKENQLMLYKEKVPSDKFGPVSLGYEGKKIAISTTNSDSVFICIAFIEESEETQGSATQSEGGGNTAQQGSNIEGGLEELMDKPIAKKVIPVDLMNKVKLNNLIFTQEERYLIADYVNSNNVKRMKVYNGSTGDSVNLNFDEMFPDNKYNLELLEFEQDEFKINVSAKDGIKDIDNEIIGEYQVDVEENTTTKI